MASTDKELEQQLLEAGKRLENPPASVEELLPLLDQVEHCLSRVEQSPTKSMQSALAPSLKSLVGDQLFGHANVDVKVAVASCISEITRITAPDAPYDDDQMKDIFQLIVSSFENLADNTSRSYGKRASILETVAKVRSCVVMLDLECDTLIAEMFQHFLNSIRDYHPENVFMSMETIMILVLEESEDISPELLSPLLDSVKKGNEEVVPVAQNLGEKVLESCASKEALPVAWKLGEKVLKSCASKVKPYLVHAVKSLGLSLDDYSDVVATICQDMCGADEQNDVHAAVENKVEENKLDIGGASEEAAQADKETEAQVALPKQADLVDGESAKPVERSNGIAEAVEAESLPDSIMPEKQEDSKHTEQSENIDKLDNAEPDNPVAEKVVDAETKQQRTTKKRGRKANSSAKLMKPSGSSHADSEKVNEKLSEGKNHGNDAPSSPREEPSLEVAVLTDDQASSLKVLEGDAVTVATPPVNKGLPEESLSKKAGRLKKEKLIKDSAPSVDDASKKTSEEETDSEEKLPKFLGNAAAGIVHEDEKPVITDASKEEGDNTSESEAKLLKQPSKKVKISGNGDGSSSKLSENKRSRIRVKASLEKKVSKSSSEDDDKISSLKSATKSAKDEPRSRETPKDVKTKRDSGKEKVSDAEESDEDLVGSKVKVWWPLDHKFYKGVIDSYDPIKKKHKVIYNDGDVEMLNLKKQRWELIDGDGDSASPSPDASPEIPLKKKIKTSNQTTRQEKMDSTPKSGGPSGKSRSVATKSGRKLKEVGETDGKPRNDLKSIRKMEDDTGSTNKERTPKSGGKSIDTVSKGAGKTKNEDGVRTKTGKSKEDDSSTPKTSKSKQDTSKTSKSKQDTPNVTSNAKEKTPKSGGKSSANGTGKSKTGSSKVRETEGKESKLLSVKTQESRKRKLASSAKGQGSEGKSEKKRQRGA